LTHIRALEVLGINGTDYGVIMTPLILSKIPNDIRLEWSQQMKDVDGGESNLQNLLDFLDKEINR
jgi:hypothetical protein